MKTIYKFATLTLMMLALSAYGFSQEKPTAKKIALNLVRGVVGPLGSSTSWSGYSTLSLISGAGVIPVTSSSTVFYLGFTAGTTADVNNMVLYTTARRSLTITAVTPVKLGGISNPSINLGSTAVCPVQPLSAINPCILRLDPLTLSLSALNDYYLVVYFTASDPNNSAIGGTTSSFLQSSMNGWYIQADESRLTTGQSIPSGNSGSSPYFLMYVMNN